MVALEIHHKPNTVDRQVKDDKTLAGIVHTFMALCLLFLQVRKFVSVTQYMWCHTCICSSAVFCRTSLGEDTFAASWAKCLCNFGTSSKVGGNQIT